MALSDFPLLSMLRARMQWHQQRQQVLAENVANADTPNYRPKDLVEPKFQLSAPGVAPLGLTRTDPAHLASLGDPSDFRSDPKNVRPQTSLSNQLAGEGDTALSNADKSTDAAAAAGLIRESIDKYRNALLKDPYNSEATLKLALAYDKVYRKGAVRVDEAATVRHRLARRASDHLPLVVDFSLLHPPTPS